jgi:nucleoside-diphosphate-sugar epimerase
VGERQGALEELEVMKILVTGNGGYVGPAVVRHLRASRPTATLVGYDAGFFFDCLTRRGPVPEVALDVQHFGDVRAIGPEHLQGVDAVVHLAAISNDPMGNAFEKVTLEVNRDASVRVAKLAKEAGAKAFVFASSCSVYGQADEAARTEESQVMPLTAYARSKVDTEGAIAGLAGPAFKVSALRFSTACGMSDRLRLDLVVNDFVACAIATKKITILSDGTPWRPLIHIEDMARAIDWAISREKGGDFVAVNVGRDDWNFQVKELAATVQKVLPGIDVSVNPNAAPDKRSYRVSFAKFRALAPDHQPRWDLEGTIRQLVEGLNALQFKDADFRSSRLMRLVVLNELRATEQLDAALRWTRKAGGRA